MSDDDAYWDMIELLIDADPTPRYTVGSYNMRPFAVDSNGVCMTAVEMPVKLYVSIMREAERVERFLDLRSRLWMRLALGPRALQCANTVDGVDR